MYCRVLNITHFVTSRYFINFLPLFFITIFLSLNAIESKFERLKKFIRFKFLFLILLIASNLVILPLYYRSEKHDYRGLVTYLKGHLRDGDKIILSTDGDFPGILHYFGVLPQGRHYVISSRRISKEEMEFKTSIFSENKKITISYSRSYWLRYALEGSRLWIVANKVTAKKVKGNPAFVLKGYFDGSFLNFDRFPTDDSIYLFLCDPRFPNEKGIDVAIE